MDNYKFDKSSPRRVASWWSILEDLLYPEKKIRDKIQRRADALKAAQVDTAIQFGLHIRFDFYYNFDAIHEYLNAVACALHERGIKFLDHYSCNTLARPLNREEKLIYHTTQRHHTCYYPDKIGAQSAGYAGYLFNDLREVDLRDGSPGRGEMYQLDLMCLNNPNFTAMHTAYLKRQIAEIALDGLQQDDMAFYNFFRSCGCQYCRERFSREYGHDLPPLSDRHFWGDTTKHPTEWGNYENPAFRDWVKMRYKVVADHLVKVRQAIGHDKILMTCCSSSGSESLNSLALSNENFINIVDWLLFENCGTSVHTINWEQQIPEALLQNAISNSANKPSIGCNYANYENGAYLGWTFSRFINSIQWISTLTQELDIDGTDFKEEGELIAKYNNWDIEHDNEKWEDITELRLAYFQANKLNGMRTPDGVEYWHRVRDWSWRLLKENINYRMIVSHNLEQEIADTTPILLESAWCVSNEEFELLKKMQANGTIIYINGEFGTHNEKREKRAFPLHLDGAKEFKMEEAIPLVKIINANHDWRIRLKQRGEKIRIDLFNVALEAVPHENLFSRWGEGGGKLLRSINNASKHSQLVFELSANVKNLVLMSPELSETINVKLEPSGGKTRITCDLSNLKLYGMLMEQ